MNREIIQIGIHSSRPVQPIDYPANAKKIKDANIQKMGGILKQFGWRQTLIVDVDGVIVAGHLRRRGAKLIGMTECPVHVAHDLTKAECKALRLADNRMASEVETDRELLAVELEDLAEHFVDLNSVTGFDVAEISDLLGYQEDVTAPEGDAPTEQRKTTLGIAIVCDTELQQRELLEEFERRSLNCRALV